PRNNFSRTQKEAPKCYNCGKKGHIARNCVNFCDLVQNSGREVYNISNGGVQLKILKCSEKSGWGKSSLITAGQTSSYKPKQKRGPSVIDTVLPYNVADDILSLPTNATVGQILQYRNQRKNLAKILKQLLLP
ncbi:5776_t:CDS:2, partial [Cetraspora pellucida]